MEKFFKWLYYYCLALFSIFMVYMCAVLAFSPRTDALERGFIPCTQRLVEQLTACRRGEVGCALGRLWQDMQCNVSVVFDGFGAWIKGKQTTPWENYLFEPVLVSSLDEDLSQYPDLKKDALQLQKQYRQLEQEGQNEEKNTEQALQLNENVLRADLADEQSEYELKSSEEPAGQSDDINDEAFMDGISSFTTQGETPEKIERPDIVLQLQKITQEKLSKEGVLDEKEK